MIYLSAYILAFINGRKILIMNKRESSIKQATEKSLKWLNLQMVKSSIIRGEYWVQPLLRCNVRSQVQTVCFVFSLGTAWVSPK